MALKCYEKYPNSELAFYYVGDNTEKDFLAPNDLGWTTVCLLDDGRNIHKQDFVVVDGYLAKYKIKNIVELLKVIR